MPWPVRRYRRRTSRPGKRRSRISGRRYKSRKYSRMAKPNKGPLLKYTGPGRAPLPDKYFTKVHYQDWVNVASGGITGVSDTVFSGNGAYDPVTGIGGKGCAGFTEFTAIYQQYRVYASKITVVIKSITDVTATGDGVILLIPDRSSVSYTMSTVIDRQATPFSKFGMINRYANGAQPLILKNFRKTKNIYGESDIDDDNYAGAIAGLPTNEWYWHVVAARGDQSSISAAPGYQMIVKITYYIRFEKRKALSAP